MEEQFQIRVVAEISSIEPQEWNGLQDGIPCNPFVSHEFLSALEESESATPQTGWLPQHLLLENPENKVIAALPCYLKNHSQGEYVFDHGWADAFMRAGGDYYPKLQACVPFTPATGPRFLGANGKSAAVKIQTLIEGLKELGRRIDASSAHVTFMQKPEWELAGSAGMLLRNDQQFHWHNEGYQNFEQFLEFLSSRKRKNIRRERAAAMAIDGVKIEYLTGADLTEANWDNFYRFYIDTGSRKWGTPYLTREFFSLVGERMRDRILLVMASRNGNHIAGAINFIGDDCLYGRHWGCIEHHPMLHFEICYYSAIQWAIENKLERVEAGAQGAHKLARGYLPVKTYSAHHITHPEFRQAVRNYLEHERSQVELEQTALEEFSPFRNSHQN